MAGTSRSGRAARGLLARLVAVLAVVAGLVLLYSPQCATAMSASMSGNQVHSCAGAQDSAPGVSSVPANGDIPTGEWGADTCAAGAAPGRFVAAASDVSGGSGSGGVLVACLAFLVAVLVVVRGLRGPASRFAAHPRVRSRRRVRSMSIPRSVSLARLCVLRT